MESEGEMQSERRVIKTFEDKHHTFSPKCYQVEIGKRETTLFKMTFENKDAGARAQNLYELLDECEYNPILDQDADQNHIVTVVFKPKNENGMHSDFRDFLQILKEHFTWDVKKMKTLENIFKEAITTNAREKNNMSAGVALTV